MFPAAQPQTAQLTGSVTWSDGTAFDGYCLLGLGVPSNDDGAWPTLMLGAGKFPSIRLPIWTVVPISQGVFNQNTNLFFNSSIDPPGTKYGAYWYDINWRLIFPSDGMAAVGFTIATNPYAITIPTLVLPTPASSIPLPQSTTNQSTPVVPGFPLTITGTQNGVNTLFTLSANPQFLLLFRNGQLLADPSDYSRAATVITMVVPPAVDDVLQAFPLGAVS